MPWHNFCLALILLFFTSTPFKAELFASTLGEVKKADEVLMASRQNYLLQHPKKMN